MYTVPFWFKKYFYTIVVRSLKKLNKMKWRNKIHKISKSSMTVLLFISGNTHSRMNVSRISQQDNKDWVD